MLKKISISLIVVIVLGWGVGHYFNICSQYSTTVCLANSSKKHPNTISINANDIIEKTNKERLSLGLSPLLVNTKLNSSAEIKVNDMIARQYFEHQSPSGEGVSDLGKRAGYEYVIMGENLALGDFADASDVVTAWMNSPGHRANILNKKYQEIGVSIKRAKYQGKEVWFAVQHFGTARSVCPSISESLKKEIDVLNNQLKEEEGIINTLKQDLESPGASTRDSYQNEVMSFNQHVDSYNSKLQTSRQKIETYNIEVKEFNRCIATFS